MYISVPFASLWIYKGSHMSLITYYNLVLWNKIYVIIIKMCGVCKICFTRMWMCQYCITRKQKGLDFAEIKYLFGIRSEVNRLLICISRFMIVRMSTVLIVVSIVAWFSATFIFWNGQ